MSPPLLAAIALAIALFGLWLLSLPLKNVSIVDPFWGSGFAIVAAVELARVERTPRALLAGALVAIWGLRLSLHLARRNLGHGEDFRYAEMRAARGKLFPFTSLFIVFGLQGALVWIISWPVQATVVRDGQPPLGVLDAAGVLLWCIGFFFESVGDAQLAAFKRDPANRGQVMDRGLWRYTRHPNYFGDATMWWGLWLLACGAGAWWTAFGPALMTFLLLRVSGVALLEKDIAERRPGYREYVRRTSAFFPRPPRRGDF